ncbi:atp-Dependent RNA helicase [Arthrobacter sp. Hiyo8]|nr:atp-Dependent RNA helicase [Arthrobacter sp. Hiyo8]
MGRRPRWALINKALGLSSPEPVETYSSSPHLFADLDIPEGTKGRLPRNQRTLAGVDAEVLEDLGETGKKNSRSGGDSGRGRSGRDSGRDGARRGPKSAEARPATATVRAAATARAAVVRPKAKQPPLRQRPVCRAAVRRGSDKPAAHAVPAPAAATAKWSRLPVPPARAPRLNGLND